MRTTLSLEPDVAVEIDRRRRVRGTTLKQEVNDLLRAGLRQADAPPAAPQRYRLPVLSTGDALAPIDDVDQALRAAEGDDYR